LVVLVLVLIALACVEQAAQSAAQFAQDSPWLAALIGLFVIAALVGAGVIGWMLWQASRARAEQARLAELARLRTLNGLLALSPTDFEHAVGKMLTWYGYRNVARTGGAGDLAADLTCTAPDGRKTVVQCKRYTPGNSVNSPTIQSFIGMVTVHHRAQLGLFVTTSSYTRPALDLAQQHHSYIQLVSGDQLVAMMQRYADQALAASKPASKVGRPA
jgi:restriction system protein